MTNRRVLLRSRPTGEPKLTNFEIADTPVPTVGDGEILRTIYLSLDHTCAGA
jgi:NADPH-dependent curcumin reductase CurA